VLRAKTFVQKSAVISSSLFYGSNFDCVVSSFFLYGVYMRAKVQRYQIVLVTNSPKLVRNLMAQKFQFHETIFSFLLAVLFDFDKCLGDFHDPADAKWIVVD
jgi:hypothetical protein